MKRFSLNSNDLFLCSPGHAIEVFRTNNLYDPFLTGSNSHWSKVIDINPNNGDELEVHNTIIRGLRLRQLHQELAKCHARSINREGCMYICTNYGHFRANDFFGWSKYGVYPPRQIGWNKLDVDSKNVVVDITGITESLVEYEQKLEEKEEELLKLLEEKNQVESLLEELSEEELSYFKKRLTKKEKELSDLEIRFAEQEAKLKIIENELSQTKRSLEEKNEDLNNANAKMKVKEREIVVLITLWEKYLGLFESPKREKQEGYKHKQEELCLEKKNLENKEKELKKVISELIVERKKANAFKAALKCLVNYLEDFNFSWRKDFDYEILLSTLCDAKYIEPLKELGGGVTVSQISKTILQIVEEQNYAQK